MEIAAERSTWGAGPADTSPASGSASSSSRIQAIGSKPIGRTTSNCEAIGASRFAASFTRAVSSGSRALSRPISSSSPSHCAPCPPKAST